MEILKCIIKVQNWKKEILFFQSHGIQKNLIKYLPYKYTNNISFLSTEHILLPQIFSNKPIEEFRYYIINSKSV